MGRISEFMKNIWKECAKCWISGVPHFPHIWWICRKSSLNEICSETCCIRVSLLHCMLYNFVCSKYCILLEKMFCFVSEIFPSPQNFSSFMHTETSCKCRILGNNLRVNWGCFSVGDRETKHRLRWRLVNCVILCTYIWPLRDIRCPLPV